MSNRCAFAWATLGVVTFVVYGCLMPFEFRALTLAEAADSFRAVLSAGAKIESRSDALANVLLDIPLGFTLLGLAGVDRKWSRAKTGAVGLLLLPACVLFSAAVEFAQLFTTTRTCSASDILAQAIGAVGGMGAWVLCGQAFTDRARAVWTRTDLNAAGQVLIAYLALVVFLQTLPFDVSASPADLYRKLRDGRVVFRPFSEFDGMTDANRWTHTAKLAKLAGLYFPIGLLAARLRGRIEAWGLLRAAGAALALGVCLEAIQLVVLSRSPSVTDALVGAFAAVAGWYAGRVHHEGLAIPFAASWGIVWVAGMTPITQPPPGTARLDTPRPFDWIPGLVLDSGEPIGALDEMLTKLVLFGLLGVLLAAWRLPPRSRREPGGSVPAAVTVAAVLGLLVGSLIEYTQRWYDTHTPSITDVLLGGLGAAVGVVVASRLRTSSGKTPPQPLPQGERGFESPLPS